MPLKAICIELRPNLSSGHVFLQFDRVISDRPKTRIVVKEHDVHIVEHGTDCTESELVLRHNSFGMDIQCISIFTVNGCHISFRFNYKTVNMEALQQCVGVPLTPQPLLLSFKERSEIVALHCSNCQSELVPACTYNRLREFPSGLIDPSEFFCHNHGPAGKAPTLVPAASDLFYGLNHIVLNTSVLDDRTINRAEHIYCKRCMCLLGLTIQAGAATKLWADALRWKPSKSEVGAQPGMCQLFKYSTVTQLMLRLFSTLWPTLPPLFCPANSRAVLVANLPDRQQHYMLIHVLDPQLSVLRRLNSEPSKPTTKYDPEELRPFRACKLYFRIFGSSPQDPSTLLQWQQQAEVPKMTISPFMFLELQNRLNRNSKLISRAWRYNSPEEKLQLTYFFYENEEQELLHLQRETHITRSPKPNLQQQQRAQQEQLKKVDDYETDTGLDASLDETDESDDERSDSDSELTSSLLHKSVPIMTYEQNLAKRWPLQKLRQPPSPPDPSD